MTTTETETKGAALAVLLLAWREGLHEVTALDVLRGMRAAGLTGPEDVRRDLSRALLDGDHGEGRGWAASVDRAEALAARLAQARTVLGLDGAA